MNADAMSVSRYFMFIMVMVTVLAGLFCEWVLARMLGGIAVLPSVAAITVIVVLAAVPLWAGLLSGAAAGFLFDSMALPPFGATMLLFVFLACAAHLFKAVVADRDSRRVRIFLCAVLVLFAFLARPLARIVAENLHFL